MLNSNSNQKNRTNDSQYFEKLSKHRSYISLIDDHGVQIIETKPAYNNQQYHIGREIYVPHSDRYYFFPF